MYKKRIVQTKIIKRREKANGTFERQTKEIRFRWISARTCRLSFLFASWISPESETQCSRRRKHWGSAKGEESKRYSNRNWNEKGNCVIYSAEQGASVSSVCTHRWIGWCKREGWRQRFVSWREVSLRKLRWNNGIECNPDRWVMI